MDKLLSDALKIEQLEEEIERLKKAIKSAIFHLEWANSLDMPHDDMIAALKAELERGE